MIEEISDEYNSKMYVLGCLEEELKKLLNSQHKLDAQNYYDRAFGTY